MTRVIVGLMVCLVLAGLVRTAWVIDCDPFTGVVVACVILLGWLGITGGVPPRRDVKRDTPDPVGEDVNLDTPDPVGEDVNLDTLDVLLYDAVTDSLMPFNTLPGFTGFRLRKYVGDRPDYYSVTVTKTGDFIDVIPVAINLMFSEGNFVGPKFYTQRKVDGWRYVRVYVIIVGTKDPLMVERLFHDTLRRLLAEAVGL